MATWLDGLLEGLPPLREIQARLSARELRGGLESLAGDSFFHGRHSELGQLRSYIGVLPPADLLGRLTGRVLE